LKGFFTNFSIYSLVKESLEKSSNYSDPSEIEPKSETPLEVITLKFSPGDCEHCKAAGHWDYGPYTGMGLLCCHTAFYLGKPGKPKPCSEIRGKCPLKDENRNY